MKVTITREKDCGEYRDVIKIYPDAGKYDRVTRERIIKLFHKAMDDLKELRRIKRILKKGGFKF